jgi:hypothetical protein
MAKRRGEYAAAAAIWQELLDDADCRIIACEELAIYHERRTRDFAKALEYARSGFAALNRNSNKSRYDLRATADLRRIERLRKRIARLEARATGSPDRIAAPLLRRSPAAVSGN